MPFALRVWIEFVLIHVLESWVLPLALAWGRVKDVPRVTGGGSTETYMTRVHLIHTRWFAVFLHRFWLSDEEGPHCHPWWWFSMILTGSYREHLLGQEPILRRAGSCAFRPSRVFHRVEVPADAATRPVWTLFIRGKHRRFWGFLPASVFEEWQLGEGQQKHPGVEKFPRVPASAFPARYEDLKRRDF